MAERKSYVLEDLHRLYGEGNFERVITSATILARSQPGADLFNLIGAAYLALGNNELACRAFGEGIALRPQSGQLHYHLGISLARTGDNDGAAAAYQRALDLEPRHADAHFNLGILKQGQCDFAGALKCYRAAVELQPGHLGAWNNSGNVCQALGRWEEAATAYRRALELDGAHAPAWNNLGNVLRRVGRDTDAMASFRNALICDPALADAHSNIGVLHHASGDFSAAISSYKAALSIEPQNVAALSNLGNALQDLGCLEEAIGLYQLAARSAPDHAEAHYNMGNALQALGRDDDASQAYLRALELRPDWSAARTMLAYRKAFMCEWRERLDGVSERGLVDGDASPPFPLLAQEDCAERQCLRSQAWCREKFPTGGVAPAFVQRSGRVRVGYFSSDVHDHATMHLLQGVLREHDRARVEVRLYSYGRRRDGDMRREAVAAVEHFHDVAQADDATVVALAREHCLDIAVDLKGYTTDARTRLFARRLAPVQVNYLGYPGTMGAPFMDYLIADPVVIAPEERRWYTENIIFLPHSYQPNDDTRKIAGFAPDRAALGLPARDGDHGFVFCCFNANYKIGPREFDVWMRLLRAVDGSVLWLLRSNAWTESNLRREAAARGVEPDRLVFADPVGHSEHLARHCRADLFLDTFHYNAHTTASDALWAGLPIVTLAGRQFAARVGASLLTAVGLGELVTHEVAQYEALALELARNPRRLQAIRQRLVQTRQNSPLFDTRNYTRHLEQAFLTIANRSREGKMPQDISVKGK